MSKKNSRNSNTIEIDTPRYNDNDPPTAEIFVLVSYLKRKENSNSIYYYDNTIIFN